mmetsp:Transcript_3287/g.10228  ORF Transcript_3287/g.10228 Transcript_3287/m.10228 type:complete len:213 (-) Transcript_3287:159-797(-)
MRWRKAWAASGPRGCGGCGPWRGSWGRWRRSAPPSARRSQRRPHLETPRRPLRPRVAGERAAGAASSARRPARLAYCGTVGAPSPRCSCAPALRRRCPAPLPLSSAVSRATWSWRTAPAASGRSPPQSPAGPRAPAGRVPGTPPQAPAGARAPHGRTRCRATSASGSSSRARWAPWCATGRARCLSPRRCPRSCRRTWMRTWRTLQRCRRCK